MRYFLTALIITFGIAAHIAFSPAKAACVCSCVNGNNIPICESSLDIEPICPPKICPIVPPSIRPIETPSIPPIGTTHCRNEQVYNQYTMRYEWKRVCQ